ncbi:MAG: LamG domain-containing protein [Deltaproteobacteria bacterium]|nr:LamG domain-containing protein [Deltaproteobacteria bacterium]
MIRLSIISALVCVSATAVHAQSGPVAWWPLDDGAGLAASELVHGLGSTLSSNNGTTGPRWVEGQGAGDGTIPPIDCNRDALHFDGVDDYVSIPDVRPEVELDGFGALTLSAWVRRTSDAGGAIVSKYDSRPGWWIPWVISIYPGQLGGVRFFVGTSLEVYRGVDTTVGVTRDRWTHIAGVWQGTDFTVYIDGLPAPGTMFQKGNFAGMYEDDDVPIEIGSVRSSSGSFTGRDAFFQGGIDDVRVYDRALSGDEIATLALGGDALATCDSCPIDCQDTTPERVLFGVVRRASDDSLGSVMCWTLETGGVDCRRDARGALLVGPPECGP